MKKKTISLDLLEAIIFDFDGVLTDNRVFVDQTGREMVCCNRGDGIAFDVLRKTHVKLFILSTEINEVITCRGKKLGIEVFQGVTDKLNSLKKLSIQYGFNLDKTLFVGNDLNDYCVMHGCGFSVCPADSHPRILDIASTRLKTEGGKGVVRELVEIIFGIDIVKTLYL